MQRCGLTTLQSSVIFLGFAVPISVVIDNLLLVIILVSVLFNAQAVWQVATQNSVARAAWLLFISLFLAMFYGVAPLKEAAGALGKYADLAFVPLFMLLLRSAESKKRAQYAFLAAMGLTLLLSYMVGFKLLPVMHWMNSISAADNPVIFHSHITQNNMMAFAVFLALLQCREALTQKLRLAWGAFAALALVNVLFLVQGRTGYVILLVLLVWFVWTTLAQYMSQRGKVLTWRQGLPVIMLLVALVIAIFYVSPRLHARGSLVVSELEVWQPNHGKDTSTGQRLDFYYNSLQIVSHHPLFGIGTGGFEAAFAEQTKGTEVLQTTNPHNEYLLITVQAGVIGLVLLFYLFFTVWRCAPLLETALEQDAARGLVLAYMVNCAFNSALHDHADGLFFSWMAAVLFAGIRLTKRS